MAGMSFIKMCVYMYGSARVTLLQYEVLSKHLHTRILTYTDIQIIRLSNNIY